MLPYSGIIAEVKLLGGADLDIRDVKLESQHLTQKDKSLNATLWSYFPVEELSTELYDENVPGFDGQGPPYDLADIARHAKQEEVRRSPMRIESLLTCYVVTVGLPCMLNLVELRARKQRNEVLPLAEAIQRVNAHKRLVNSIYVNGEYDRAALSYFKCLLDLMPWYACPLFLTAEQAIDSGLAELEASLWNNLCIATLRSSLVDEDHRTSLALGACMNVLQMRYVPTKLLHRSHGRLCEVFKMRKRGALELPPCNESMVATLEESMPEIKDKDSMAWMHRHCITEHVCYSERMVEKFRQEGKERAEERARWRELS